MLISTFILKPYLLVGAMSGHCEISRSPVDSSSALVLTTPQQCEANVAVKGNGKYFYRISYDFLAPDFHIWLERVHQISHDPADKFHLLPRWKKKINLHFKDSSPASQGLWLVLLISSVSLMFGCGWLSRDFAVIMIMNKAQKSDIYCLKHSITITASVESFEF